jgi:hypothetical protein
MPLLVRIPGTPRNRRLRRLWHAGLAVIVALSVLVGLLVLVIGWAATTFGGDHPHPAASGAPTRPAASATGSADPRDVIADRPMASLPLSAAQPQPLASVPPGAHLRVPAATLAAGAHGVPAASGFPHTAEGAVGQLAAIDEAVLSTLRPAETARVYRWVAAPGAPSLLAWTMSVDVHDMLRAASDADTVAGSYQVSQAQIKGSVGADWVVVCVLGEMDLTIAQTVRAGVGDCERMTWQAGSQAGSNGGRWRIGAGREPAAAPDAWPGSADAFRVGWREIDHG